MKRKISVFSYDGTWNSWFFKEDIERVERVLEEKIVEVLLPSYGDDAGVYCKMENGKCYRVWKSIVFIESCPLWRWKCKEVSPSHYKKIKDSFKPLHEAVYV